MEASSARKKLMDKRKLQLSKKAEEEKQQKAMSTANARMKRDEALAKRKRDKQEYAQKVHSIEAKRH